MGDIAKTLYRMTAPSKLPKLPKPLSDEKLNEVKAALDGWVLDVNREARQ